MPSYKGLRDKFKILKIYSSNLSTLINKRELNTHLWLKIEDLTNKNTTNMKIKKKNYYNISSFNYDLTFS